MLLGSLVIFLAVFVNSLKSFNLRLISDLQSQNNYFYSVQHPVTAMENSLITEVPSPHFSSTKGPMSSVEIQNHSKQLDQLMNSRNNVTEDFARMKSRIKPLKIKRKFKNKRRLHKKVSNTRTRLHYNPDESNKLLHKGVINDSVKKHGSRAIKNILKTNFAETEDAVSSAKNVQSKRKGYNENIRKRKTNFKFKKHNNFEKSADETSHVKNYLKRYFRCQKDDDKCVQKSKVKNKIIHSLHTAEYVTPSNVIRMLPEDMTEKSLVDHTSAPSKLLIKTLEEYISVKNVTRTALTNYSSDLNSTNLHKYSLKSHKDANHSSTFFDNFSSVIVSNSNVSVNSTTQSANILKSNYNKSKEKATINFVTTPFLNYSELNKTGINYFRQYSKDVVFSGVSVKINGSSIKKNGKQPQSPKDMLYDLISCSSVDLTKISVEAREREREYYLPPNELTFDEMALVDPSLSPIALSARAIEWTLFGFFFLGILFMSIITLLFAKVKDKHSYHYIKEKITDNEALKNFVSAFSFAAREKVETPELILKTPSSSCSSYVSLSSVVGDNFKENPSHNWDSVEKFLLKR